MTLGPQLTDISALVGLDYKMLTCMAGEKCQPMKQLNTRSSVGSRKKVKKATEGRRKEITARSLSYYLLLGFQAMF